MSQYAGWDYLCEYMEKEAYGPNFYTDKPIPPPQYVSAETEALAKSWRAANPSELVMPQTLAPPLLPSLTKPLIVPISDQIPLLPFRRPALPDPTAMYDNWNDIAMRLGRPLAGKQNIIDFAGKAPPVTNERGIVWQTPDARRGTLLRPLPSMGWKMMIPLGKDYTPETALKNMNLLEKAYIAMKGKRFPWYRRF